MTWEYHLEKEEKEAEAKKKLDGNTSASEESGLEAGSEVDVVVHEPPPYIFIYKNEMG